VSLRTTLIGGAAFTAAVTALLWMAAFRQGAGPEPSAAPSVVTVAPAARRSRLRLRAPGRTARSAWRPTTASSSMRN